MTRTSQLLVKRLALLVLASPLACEIGKQLEQQTNDDGSGSDESTTADDAGDPPATTDDSATSMLPPGDDSGSDSGTGGVGSGCGLDEVMLVTEFDANQTDLQWEPQAYYFDGIGVGIEFDADDGELDFPGLLLMRTGELPDPPAPVHGSGYVHEPAGSPSQPNAWYCFDETSTFFESGDEVMVTLQGLRRFGACPGGAPIEGTITACFGDASCGGESQLDVALTDITYVAAISGSVASESDAAQMLTRHSVGDHGDGLLGMHATGYELIPGMQVSPLGEVFFISPPDQPDGGAIYCAGEGSTLTYDGSSGDFISASFSNITRLGSCNDEGGDPGTGALCANFGG